MPGSSPGMTDWETERLFAVVANDKRACFQEAANDTRFLEGPPIRHHRCR